MYHLSVIVIKHYYLLYGSCYRPFSSINFLILPNSYPSSIPWFVSSAPTRFILILFGHSVTSLLPLWHGLNTSFLSHHSPWQPTPIQTFISLIFTSSPYFWTLLSLLYFLHDIKQTRSFLSHQFPCQHLFILLHPLTFTSSPYFSTLYLSLYFPHNMKLTRSFSSHQFPW